MDSYLLWTFVFALALSIYVKWKFNPDVTLPYVLIVVALSALWPLVAIALTIYTLWTIFLFIQFNFMLLYEMKKKK